MNDNITETLVEGRCDFSTGIDRTRAYTDGGIRFPIWEIAWDAAINDIDNPA